MSSYGGSYGGGYGGGYSGGYGSGGYGGGMSYGGGKGKGKGGKGKGQYQQKKRKEKIFFDVNETMFSSQSKVSIRVGYLWVSMEVFSLIAMPQYTSQANLLVKKSPKRMKWNFFLVYFLTRFRL